MFEQSPGTYAAIGCAVVYWTSVALLVVKNPHRREAPIVVGMALAAWPCLLLGGVAQLLFLIPLYTVIISHGWAIPQHLPLRTAVRAIVLTILGFALLVAVAIWSEPQ